MRDVADGGVPVVDAADLSARIAAGEAVTVLDVRNRDEFDRWSVTGPSVEAVQVPHQRFIAARVTETTPQLVAGLDEPLVVVCAVGQASAEVAAQLRDAGVDAANLTGGMAAWADLYVATRIPCESATVVQYRRPSSGCLAHLVVAGETADAETGERAAAVIDPLRAFTDRYVADAADLGATIRWAVDTHVHADHVSGVRDLTAATGATAVLPSGAEARGLSFGDEIPLTLVRDGDPVTVGNTTLTAIALPGHTSEMTGYRLADDGHGDLLFAGDSVFLDGVARPDLEVDAAEVREMARRLHRTMRTIRALPDSVRIAPSHHGEATVPVEGAYVESVAALRERIDLLSADESAFVDRVTRSMPPRPANDDRLVAVNLGRESVDDETAAELELGPNHCAVAEG